MYLATKLNALAGADPAHKAKLLMDLAGLLNRSSYLGGEGNFSFHDPEIAARPDRLADAEVRSIALRVGPVLLDPRESERVRAAAAFVLGKTHSVEALQSIVRAISAESKLPAEVARQCAFAYDTLADAGDRAGPETDPEAVGRHFVRHDVPWDHAAGRVVVDRL